MRIDTPASSHVSYLDYDPTTNDLLVGFRNGSVYKYAKVPGGVFETVSSSESVGRALHTLIKGSYDVVKVR